MELELELDEMGLDEPELEGSEGLKLLRLLNGDAAVKDRVGKRVLVGVALGVAVKLLLFNKIVS